ncbi:4-(cytidine 5'-diphospho)-2-C-methyl-D-erythritol kinase [Cladophialophora psammophila CBS 110553]|uniref:4-(cytidine 5'-diphospho)-2-C-methyl-D-erythritol kinase n=1 Tax=Cladophialophora psammophila CBS 110553 TaxID=1182543 RepID=W9W2X6_9EURO|nr:4-(cytidine 5'-diphospho)-2-C-methyl-D-erythritol kinase [Cladophialophora psammophila CBS 110553]EXJ59335.1 4-(cytidine 5'-diphospho)-2-C-methyl-D-erythritol kinase [Cladophialophora psammophila CBS 110553]
MLRVPAKLNLHLQVGLRREDGYHDITTAYQAVSLYDIVKISLTEASRGVTITVTGVDSDRIPTDSRNLVVRAAQALSSHIGIDPNLHFELIKSIPTGGGLGGGSADAAAALVGSNILWKAGADEDCLLAIAARIGEDVPFFVKGVVAISTGHMQPPMSLKHGNHIWYWVLGILPSGLSTKEVFEKHDEVSATRVFCEETYRYRRERCVKTAWGSTPPHLLIASLLNDLEEASIELLPSIGRALSAGKNAGALASLLAGSGSACAFLARSEDHARGLVLKLQEINIFRQIALVIGPVGGVRVLG